MSDEIAWKSPSMEGKWKDNKGVIHLRSIEYYGKDWIDMRIMNMSKTPPHFTRHGVRLTLTQAKEMVVVLKEMVAAMQEKREKDERKSGEH
jgi:hypothetical protein